MANPWLAEGYEAHLVEQRRDGNVGEEVSVTKSGIEECAARDLLVIPSSLR